MPQTASKSADTLRNSPERLIHAVLDAWAAQGHAAISTRSLAQAAGLPVSSIYHHFGTLEQLFLSAQDYARTGAEQWCAARLDELACPHSLSPAALPALLSALIDEWSHGERRIALAWRECYMLAVRDARYAPALDSWRALWMDFFGQICACCGLDGFGEATSLFFDGESLLHLTRWRRTVDRACLQEQCEGWGRWLGGSLAAEGPWRQYARAEAGGVAPEMAIASGIPEQIATAAADIVERLGMAGLTHRAVAAEAGLTLGMVSRNFRTSADLARASFEMIYRRAVTMVETHIQAAAVEGRNDPRPPISGYQVTSVQMLALDELMLAVAREEELQPFAPQLRYLRGRSSGPYLASLLGPGATPSRLDAALFSSFQSGLKRARATMTDAEGQDYADRLLEQLLHTLGGAMGRA
jgi:AcrR family transcriptional regulator